MSSAIPIGLPVYPAEASISINAGSAKTAMPTEHYDALKAHPVGRNMPDGLCKSLAASVSAFPLRIMIVDNSGSMRSGDGSLMLMPDIHNDKARIIQSSRWSELTSDVERMAALSEALQARTDIHLLNANDGYDTLTIAGGSSTASNATGIRPLGPCATAEQVKVAMRSPSIVYGSTPLAPAVERIIKMIEPRAASLKSQGKRVAVIIATDGLPDSPSAFLRALQHLQRLPVYIVVRLCTSEGDVTEYWNDLDAQLEAPLEVLDDARSEAKEIARVNPWLTYASELHDCRLFGLRHALFDRVDEARLMPFEVKLFCEELLGVALAPDPTLEPEAFVRACKEALGETMTVIDPRSLRKSAWLNLKELEWAIHPKSPFMKCVPASQMCVIS